MYTGVVLGTLWNNIEVTAGDGAIVYSSLESQNNKYHCKQGWTRQGQGIMGRSHRNGGHGGDHTGRPGAMGDITLCQAGRARGRFFRTGTERREGLWPSPGHDNLVGTYMF